MKEKHIENEILSYLAIIGIVAWKQESVGVFDAKIGRYRMKRSVHRIVGLSDIQGIIPSCAGRALCIEVKSEKGRLSPAQTAFLDRAREAGALAFVARSVEDVEFELFRAGAVT